MLNYVTGYMAFNFSMNYVPIINDCISHKFDFTFGGYNGTSKNEHGFSLFEVKQL